MNRPVMNRSAESRPPVNRNELRDSLRKMIAVLEDERQALAGLDVEAISAAATSKRLLCNRLDQATALSMDAECRGLAESARRLNEMNRQVRNLVAANVSARLDLLTGTPALYHARPATRPATHPATVRNLHSPSRTSAT